MKEIIERIERMMEELRLPATSFCKNVDISTSTYYRVIKGELNLSAETAARIDNYLKRYGF